MNGSEAERSPGETVRRGLDDADRLEGGLRRLLRSLAPVGDPELSPTQRQLVRRSAGGPGLTELARALGLPKSTASVMVGDLVRRRLLRRTRAGDDGRRVVIRPTAAGMRRAAEDRLLDPTRLALALSGLAESDRDVLLGVLERLVAASEALPATGTLVS